MALDNTTTVPKIVAANFLAALRQSQVFASKTNSSWAGQLGANGNEVIINTEADAAIGDYNRTTQISYAGADVGTPVTLQINKTKSWAIKYNDLDAAISKPDVLTSSVQAHGVKMAEVVDADVRAAMDSGASEGPALALDHTGNKLVLDSFKFATLHRVLDLNNVPRSGRFLIVGPYMAEALQRIALKNDVLLAGNNTQSLANGNIGNFGGFSISVAPGAYSTFNASQMSATETAFYGVNSATAYVDQIRKTERLRLESEFADAVRGLMSYGYKVIDSKRLFKSAVSVTKVPA